MVGGVACHLSPAQFSVRLISIRSCVWFEKSTDGAAVTTCTCFLLVRTYLYKGGAFERWIGP